MRIAQEVYEAMVRQARSRLPEEACGYLLGDSAGNAVLNYPMTNIDHSPTHFAFDPKEQFAATRYARSHGLTVIANWHSHPCTPARPSEEDIRLAHDPAAAYLILSLAGEVPVLRAFSIRHGEVTRLSADITPPHDGSARQDT